MFDLASTISPDTLRLRLQFFFSFRLMPNAWYPRYQLHYSTFVENSLDKQPRRPRLGHGVRIATGLDLIEGIFDSDLLVYLSKANQLFMLSNLLHILISKTKKIRSTH